MKLNDRLSEIAGKIPKCNILADIGTDHGYIPIYALENGLCKKALAADLREGPLKMAYANIKKSDVEKSIELRLGNGLEPISLSECDVVVIAGMGGNLIKEILADSLEKAKAANLLLLQPNNAVDSLRRWLNENGFEITDESLALDAEKLYNVLSAKWTGKIDQYDQFSYYIGKKLLERKQPLLERYLNKKLKELDVIIEGRSKACKRRNYSEEYPNSMETSEYIEIRDKLEAYLKGEISE